MQCLRAIVIACLTVSLSACAHGKMDPTRKVRILALAGVATMAAGGVAASGCDFDDSGCATPDPPAIGMGVGLVVTGAALLGVALVMRKGRAPGAVLMRKPTPGPLNPTLP